MNDGDPAPIGPGYDLSGESSSQVLAHQEMMRAGASGLEDIETALPADVDAGATAFTETADGGTMSSFTSAAAMRTMAENWKTKTAALQRRTGYLKEGIRNAADAYRRVDESNAVGIDGTGQLVQRVA